MSEAPGTEAAGREDAAGVLFAVIAYGLWGIMALYVKLVAHVPALEVMAHRAVWALPAAGAAVLLMGQGPELRAALRSWRVLATAAQAALLVSINWGLYIWAVVAGHTMDAALAYFINPIFTVLLGAMVLGERLTRGQWVAIGLTTLAVAVLTWSAGGLPLVAVGLFVSWGLYGLVKKRAPLGASVGFVVEVLLLAPVAAGYVIWLEVAGTGHLAAGPPDAALLIGAGVLTAVPLMSFAHAARRLRMTTIGLLQYVSPTLTLLLAALVFHESVDPARMVAFPLIWVALAIFSLSLWRQARG